MCSGSRARITSSVKTLLPKSWRIGTDDLGARRPWLGHEVTASMAASLARVWFKGTDSYVQKMPDPPRVGTTSQACERTLSGPSCSSRSRLRAGASERASWESAWALSFLIKLGDHGLRVRLHIILAAFAAKVEGSSLRGDLEGCTHIAEVVAADRADRLLERE